LRQVFVLPSLFLILLINKRMQEEKIKVGDVVRHRHLMQGTNLSVIKINEDSLMVRYANQGVFITQDLFLHEVEIFIVDEDEFL